jgi:hypothetical protein
MRHVGSQVSTAVLLDWIGLVYTFYHQHKYKPMVHFDCVSYSGTIILLYQCDTM